MAASPIFDSDAPPGYVSAEAKSRYIVLVAVTAGVVLVLQMVLPSIISLSYMPRMMVPDISVPAVDRGTVWKGRLWIPKQSIQRSGPTLLDAVPIGGEEQAAAPIEVPLDVPWLLPEGDRLWLIAENGVGVLEHGEVRVSRPRKLLNYVSPPFWYAGEPAVLEESAGGVTLLVYADGEWNSHGTLELATGDSQPSAPPPRRPGTRGLTSGSLPTRVLEVDGEFHVFRSHGRALWTRKGLPLAPSGDDQNSEEPADSAAEPLGSDAALRANGWRKVEGVSGVWDAVVLDGQPAIFHQTGRPPWQSELVGVKREGSSWVPFFRHKTMAADFGVAPLDESGAFLLLVQGLAGGMQVLRVDGEQVVEVSRGGSGMFGPMHAMMRMQWLAIGINLLLLAVFVLAIHWGMRTCRTAEFPPAGESAGVVQLASMGRRSVAAGIDLLIGYAPWTAIWYVYADEAANPTAIVEEFLADPRAMLIKLAFWIGASVAWWLLYLLVFSFTEGRWGWTIGKWMAGIRVVGTDLRPCGFLRAIGRNLLAFVDSMFSYMVGLLLIAFTPSRQRLGDLAVKTVVIRANPGDSGMKR